MMKAAISNIAWNGDEESLFLPRLRQLGIEGIEVAPTKIWNDYKGITRTSAETYRRSIESEGLKIPALQAIFFGKPELQFLVKESRQAFLDHIRRIADLAASLETEVLVFGAPKNRRRFDKSHDEAFAYAVDFLQEIGEECQRRKTCFAWEHNPIEYQCDFITNPRDAMLLLSKVAHPGVGLHLDSGGIHLCRSSLSDAISLVADLSLDIVHFHLSEPFLEGFECPNVNHQENLAVLNNFGYANWVSIEMKRQDHSWLAIEAAVATLVKI